MSNVIPLPKLKPSSPPPQAPTHEEKTCATGWHLPSRANPRLCQECFAWPLKP